jgi:hypothetical protein
MDDEIERVVAYHENEAFRFRTTKHYDAAIVHDEFVALIKRLAAERDAFATTMVAAAEEIHEHWDAHCDAEGYGPANLMRRLEEGIPSQYGYTAGAFAELKQRAEAAEAEVKRQQALAVYWTENACKRAAERDAAEAEVAKLRELVIRAAEFCDYATADDALPFGIRCCCQTRDWEPHKPMCEYGQIAARKREGA